MHQVLEACPSPPHPRVLLLHSLGYWLELCWDLERHPIERAGSKVLVPASTSHLEVKGLHQEGRSVKKQEVVQICWI